MIGVSHLLTTFELAFIPSGLTVEHVSVTAKSVMFDVRSIAHSVPCPDCHEISDRVHSRYTRSPRDLPLGEYAVRLAIHARRFQCRNPHCSRRTFVERLPDVVPLYAQ